MSALAREAADRMGAVLLTTTLPATPQGPVVIAGELSERAPAASRTPDAHSEGEMLTSYDCNQTEEVIKQVPIDQ